jgi:secreted trypsin-like serine protease
MFFGPPPRSTPLARFLRGAALAGAAGLAALPALPAEGQITPQIVNGEPEFAEPTTAALLQGLVPTTALVVCTATLVGCDLAISAGHCFNLNAAQRKTLYFQHAGFYEIESAVRQPAYANCYDQGGGICNDQSITRQEDISVIKLTTPVTGVTPSSINVTETPGPATPGRIVGFGRDPLTEPSSFFQNPGLKRSGSMTLAACQDPTLSPYDILCWDPSEVIGDPGEDASTCNIDSGGPLFIDQNGVRIVAGLTKGALNQGPDPCVPPVEAWDTNVYRHHAWIEQTAAQLGAIDLSVKNCGILPQLADDDAAPTCSGSSWFEGEEPRVCGFQGELGSSPLPQQQLHSFQVPAFTQRLRVNLNGISRTTNAVDVSYYVRAGTPPTTSVYDCAGVATGNFATCEFNNPQAGTWYVLAVRVTGTVAYQITATEFGPNPDTDEDGLEDPFDNCTLVSNAAQKDLDTDGCGDLCDGDFDNDGAVGPSDFNTFKSAYLTNQGDPGYNPLADMDCNGTVSPMDYSIFKSGYTLAPGPSGLPPELKTFPACP